MTWIEMAAQRRPPQPPPGVTPPENAADWYRIENAADDADSTDIYVYDAVGGFFGMYADDFIRDLRAVSTRNINLRINSPGGSVFEGVAIANAIRSHSATVTCYVDSLAASIASIIALAGDRLVMQPQSMLMIHDASASVHGNAQDMQETADLLDKTSNNLAGAYAAKAGGTVAEWRDRMRAETWMTAEEAVDLGLADEAMPMLPKKSDGDDAGNTASEKLHTLWDLSMYRYAGREKAPDPVAVAAPAAKAGTVITTQLAAGLTDPSVLDQFKALMRSAVHDEIAELFDAVAPKHSTAVEAGTWDAGANEKRLPSPVPVATVKRMYTYWDGDQAEDGKVPKSACKLPHHFVSADGSPGAASVSGVRNALARLPQTQGLTPAERSAAEAHLRAHLNAFNGDEEDHVHDDGIEAHEHGGHAPKFAVGGRVKITVTPHEEGQDTGTVAEINDGPAYGIRFDNSGEGEHGEGDIHRWYAEDELETAPDGPPPDEDEHTAQADTWEQVVGFLVSPTSPSADDVFAQLKEGW